MKKIIFSDVDGTLVDHSFCISDEINKKIVELDLPFVVATGRMYDTAKDLNLAVESDMICSNGSEVIVNSNILHQTTMDHNEAISIINNLLNERNYINIYTTSGVYVPYFEGLNSIIMEDTYRYAKGHSKSVDDFKENVNAHLELFYYTNEIVDDIESVLQNSRVIKIEIVDCMDMALTISELENEFAVSAYSSFGNNLEVVPQGITKVHGINKYIEHKGFEDYITFAIGDGNNDIEMIKFATVGIAMGNASEELKKHADFIVSDQSDGGLIEALAIIENYKTN